MHMRLFCQNDPSHEGVSIGSTVELWNDGSVKTIEEPVKATCVQCGGVVKASLPPGWVMQESRILDDQGDTYHIVQLIFFAPDTFIAKSLIAIAADALRDIIATLEGDEKEEAIGYCTDEDKPGFGIFMGIENSDLDFLWKALRERLSILAISFLGYEWYDSSGYEENGPWTYINSEDPLSTT